MATIIQLWKYRLERDPLQFASLDAFFDLAQEKWREDLAKGQAETRQRDQGGAANPALSGHVLFAALVARFVPEFEKVEGTHSARSQDLLNQITASWCAAIPSQQVLSNLMEVAQDSPRKRALSLAKRRIGPIWMRNVGTASPAQEDTARQQATANSTQSPPSKQAQLRLVPMT